MLILATWSEPNNVTTYSRLAKRKPATFCRFMVYNLAPSLAEPGFVSV